MVNPFLVLGRNWAYWPLMEAIMARFSNFFDMDECNRLPWVGSPEGFGFRHPVGAWWLAPQIWRACCQAHAVNLGTAASHCVSCTWLISMILSLLWAQWVPLECLLAWFAHRSISWWLRWAPATWRAPKCAQGAPCQLWCVLPPFLMVPLHG